MPKILGLIPSTTKTKGVRKGFMKVVGLKVNI
jgi:hypothetical protein